MWPCFFCTQTGLDGDGFEFLTTTILQALGRKDRDREDRDREDSHTVCCVLSVVCCVLCVVVYGFHSLMFSFSDPAGPGQILPPRLLPLRHLQRESGWSPLHRGHGEQDLLRQRLPQVCVCVFLCVCVCVSVCFFSCLCEYVCMSNAWFSVVFLKVCVHVKCACVYMYSICITMFVGSYLSVFVELRIREEWSD